MEPIKKINALLLCITLLALSALQSCKKKKNDNESLSVETGTVKDREGNIYQTVKIGNQWWMAENLRVRVYNDSTAIQEVKSTDPDSIWAKKTIGAFCSLDKRYGIHYNWYAVSNRKKIAPLGWHIPTDEDWKILEKTLGMSQPDADKTSWRGINETEKLIPVASTGWPSSTIIFGTNESGFCALPGGCRLFNGKVGELTTSGYWWSSTETTSSKVWYRSLASDHLTIFRYYVDKKYGLTVRCIRDK